MKIYIFTCLVLLFMYAAKGIVKMHLRTTIGHERTAAITNEELRKAVRARTNRISSRGASKGGIGSGTDLQNASGTNSDASQFLRHIEAGRQVMHGTSEQAFENRKKFYALRRLHGSSQIFFTVSPDDLRFFNILLFLSIFR